MAKIQKKELTADQFRRANTLTVFSITFVYAIFLFLNFASPIITKKEKFIYLGIYLVWYGLTAFFTSKFIEKRITMFVMAAAFEMSYCLLIMTTPAMSIFLIFPVLLIITVYLNEVLYLWGALGSCALMIIKSTVMRFTPGTTSEEFYCVNIAIIGVIISLACGFKAIRMLIDFSNAETNAVKVLLDKQKKVAGEVEKVTNDVANDFATVMEDLERINGNVATTVCAIEQIAQGSEQTAQAATEQANMTNEIQERLEGTNRIASTAKATSDDLKKTVDQGMVDSVELEKQSKIVDEYATEISTNISELTEKVTEVSHITDTILSISSQTNLLALNASIEAARAGEAGKGFAVVAEEIRQLAEGTKKSTEMITQIMNELSSVTDKVQVSAEKSGESIASQREKIKLVAESFNIVDKGIEELSTNVNDMNEEVIAVLSANNRIVDNVDTLAAVSEEMSSNAINSANDTNELGKSMEKFTSIIEVTEEKISTLREITSNN